MTREEAKKIIFNQWQSFLEHNIDYGGISEAYKMAIQALEQQPCEDCISRAEALHACCDEWNKDYKAIMKSIRQLPSVKPKAESEEGD